MMRSRIKSKSFKKRHRKNPKDFTRERKLPFRVLILILLQKSLKSLQLVLNEFFLKLDGSTSKVSNSAFTQARQKLSYTAYIELCQETVVEPYYADGDYRRWRQFRLVGADGSRVILPSSEEILEEFGRICYTNGKDKTVIGEHPVALASVFYDLLNDIPLDSKLESHSCYEVDLAVKQLSCLQENDLLIFDRGYTTYEFLAILCQQGHQFLGRCSTGSLSAFKEMFKSNAPQSKIVTLTPSKVRRKELRALGLPLEIRVRLLRIILKTGEVEVLVTSLLDEVEYPHDVFKDLYNLRWGVETFYGKIKGLLTLENFSGRSAEAIKQDFYATILISALESVITEDAQEQLADKLIQNNNKHPQQVNKAVSFNVIKNQVIDLLYSKKNPEQILKQLTELFITNPVCVRKQRDVDRKKTNPRQLYNHSKRVRKICF